MGYKGTSRIVSCSQGGLTGATNIDSIQPNMMVWPSRNLVFEKRGRRKRGGTAHLYAAAYTGTPRILGVYDCTFRSLTQYIIAATDDGDVYKDDTNKIATGMGTSLPYSFSFGENKLFIADGVGIPKVWTGSGSAAAIATPASDWSTTPPFQFLLHGRNASQRMCALNANTLYLSKNFASAGDMEIFVTGSESFYIDTGDGYGLVGMVEIGEEIVVFGKNKAYRINDSDTDTANWGIEPAQWDGGASNWRLIIKTPSDVICMADDGEIYSVIAVNSYGDYKRASITRESWMHDWIKDYVNLEYIDLFHGLYDPRIRAIRIWVVRNGMTSIDTSLLYFIDREPSEAWMIHNNDVSASGNQASAAAIIKNSSGGSYSTYTGDYLGNLWKLDQANRNDDGAGYYAGFRTPNDAFDNPRSNKHFNAMRAIIEPKGNYNLQVKVWVDGVSKATGTISMYGAYSILGTFLLGTNFLAAEDLLDERMQLGYKGKRIQYEMYNANANEDFFISGYMTDYKPAGLPRG